MFRTRIRFFIICTLVGFHLLRSWPVLLFLCNHSMIIQIFKSASFLTPFGVNCLKIYDSTFQFRPAASFYILILFIMHYFFSKPRQLRLNIHTPWKLGNCIGNLLIIQILSRINCSCTVLLY